MTNKETRAVIWDVDGTLIDSMEYHWLMWRDALAAEGVALTRERFEESFGQRNDAVISLFLGRAATPEEVARIGEAKESRYRNAVRTRGIELLPGVARWLRRLKAEGWRQAIASSAPPANIEAIVETLDLAQFFDAIVSAEDVPRGKPDPAIFLEAARRLEAAPARSVVMEDAHAGIEAARRAGMKSIGVLSTHEKLDADISVKTLDDLPDDALDKLIGGA